MIGARPDIRRWPPAVRVTEPVVLLKKCERTADRPVLVLCRIRGAVRERINCCLLPRLERTTSLGHDRRSLRPWLAIGDVAEPVRIVPGFALLDHRDHPPRHAGPSRHRGESLLARDKSFRDGCELGGTRQPGERPTHCVRRLEGGDVGHHIVSLRQLPRRNSSYGAGLGGHQPTHAS